MNKTILIICFIAFICIVGRLIGHFFDIPISYYLPIIIWFIALALFDLLLERNHKNTFLNILKE
tara:strand:- start:266 stop:457 length:192 start_codon:yes stop_codon:yes gene_type:complete